MTDYTVAVPGGDLAVVRWAGGDVPVLAAHGITGNALVWGAVARRSSGVDLIAPDLRGRGLSRTVTGPYGLVHHADDLVRVLDHLDITEPVVLMGHSMGGFVACLAATRYPERFARLVLVDGGFDFGAPPGVDLLTTLADMIRPSVRRVELEFETPGAFYDYWRENTAFGPLWNDDVRAHVDRDLTGTAPRLRSSCVLDAVRADGIEILGDADALAAIHHLPVPATFLWAEYGGFDGQRGFYDPDRLAVLPDTVDVRFVPGVNHYSIVMGETGADAIAAAIGSAV